MIEVKRAIDFAVNIANNNSHGYSQPNRTIGDEEAEIRETDCSALVISSYLSAGADVGNATYTGNMYQVFTHAGFVDVRNQVDIRDGRGLKAGDVLLKHFGGSKGHTALYIGDGKIVHAVSNYDGRKGDSSGREVMVDDYYDGSWMWVLRFPQAEPKLESPVPQIEMIKETGGIGEIVNVRQWCHRREKPTSASKSVGQAYLGDSVAINGKRMVNGSVWYHDSAGNWIHSDFVEIEANQIPWM